MPTGSCTRARSGRSASRDDGQLASEQTLVQFEHLFGHYKRSKYLAEHEVLRAGAAGLPGRARAPDVPGRRGRHRADADRPHDPRVPERPDPRLRRHRAERRARRRRRPRPRARGASGADRVAATCSAARTCRCRRCSPTLADVCGLEAPRVRLSARAVLPIVRTAEWLQSTVLRREPTLPSEPVRMATTRMEYDDSRARSELGYTSIPAREALARAASWYVEHGFVKGPAWNASAATASSAPRSTCGHADPRSTGPAAGRPPVSARRVPRPRQRRVPAPRGLGGTGSGRGRRHLRRARPARGARPRGVRAARALRESADAARAAHASGSTPTTCAPRARTSSTATAGATSTSSPASACSRSVGAIPGSSRRSAMRWPSRSRTSCRWSALRSPGCSPKRSSRACRTTTYRCFFTNSGAESVETVLKYARCATGRSRVLFADHAFHGLTTGALVAERCSRVPRPVRRRCLPGCRAVPFGDLDALERELRARRRRRVRRRADPGQGRVRRARRLPARRRRALSPPRRVARDRRGADRARSHRHVLRVRAVGRRARSRDGRQGAVGRLRAGRCGDREEPTSSRRCSTRWTGPSCTARRSARTCSR